MTDACTVSGGCQCGAVRYQARLPSGHAAICHCRMCQKAFGNWEAALVSIPETHLTWTRGAPGVFRSSAIVARGFCRDCGTPLFMKENGDPNYEMAIGSLDDPEFARPTEQVGIESELSWFKSLPKLPTRRTEDNCSQEYLEKLRTLQHPDHDTETWTA